MIFKIIPNEQTPILPEMTQGITEFIDENKQLLDNFMQYFASKRNAVGLASNQVSINNERIMQRFFTIRDNSNNCRIIINPIINEYIGMKRLKEEGCLTWVGRKIFADRYHRVKVSYYTIDGEFKTGEIYSGFQAQIWQHEINHLNGVIENVVDPNIKLQQPYKEPERNDMCPCGSSIKYKKCCIEQKIITKTLV